MLDNVFVKQLIARQESRSAYPADAPIMLDALKLAASAKTPQPYERYILLAMEHTGFPSDSAYEAEGERLAAEAEHLRVLFDGSV